MVRNDDGMKIMVRSRGAYRISVRGGRDFMGVGFVGGPGMGVARIFVRVGKHFFKKISNIFFKKIKNIFLKIQKFSKTFLKIILKQCIMLAYFHKI